MKLMKIYWLLLTIILVVYFVESVFQFASQISDTTINIIVLVLLGLCLFILIMTKYGKGKDSNINIQIGLHFIATVLFALLSLF